MFDQIFGNYLVSSGTITKEQFKAMNVAQRTELYQSNRELYDELSK